MNNIAICIPTSDRQEQLKTLLKELRKQTIFNKNLNAIHVIIVDNNSKRTSESIYNENNGLIKNLHYFVEPKRGYANVRNKCLQEAIKLKSSYLAFIDDDEFPCKEWLEELLASIKESKADAVFGPVKPVFIGEPYSYITKGKFFVKEFDESKSIRELPKHSCNVIINLASINGIKFDANFNKLGGEDTKFFKDMEISKKTIFLWNKKAIVYENIPNSRCEINWFIRRAYNAGKSNALLCMGIENYKLKVYSYLIFAGTVNIIRGLIFLLISLFQDTNRKIKALQSIARGFGRINAVIFIRYKE